MIKREARGSFELSAVQIKRGRQHCIGGIAALGVPEDGKEDTEGKTKCPEENRHMLREFKDGELNEFLSS